MEKESFFSKEIKTEESACAQVPEAENEILDVRQEKEERQILKNTSVYHGIGNRIEDTGRTFEMIILNADPKNKKEEGWKKSLGNLGKYKENQAIFYSEKDYKAISDILEKIQEKVSEISADSKNNLITNNNLCHTLNNGPFMMLKLAARELAIAEKDGLPLDDKHDAMMIENKKVWDNFFYYLDLLATNDKKCEDVLIEELKYENGYLRNFAGYYLKGKVPSESVTRIAHIRFFTLLEGIYPDSNSELVSIRKMEDVLTPVMSKEDFEREFDNLRYKELLDKEKIFKNLFKERK